MWREGGGTLMKKWLLTSQISSSAGEYPTCKNPRRQGHVKSSSASAHWNVKDRLGKPRQEQTVWITGCNLAKGVCKLYSTPGVKRDAEKAYKLLLGLCYMVGLRFSSRETTRCQEHIVLWHLLKYRAFILNVSKTARLVALPFVTSWGS